jgi:GNAT superfamily N-acetyltransferase
MVLSIRAAVRDDMALLEGFALSVPEVSNAARVQDLVGKSDLFVALIGHEIVGLVVRDQSFFGRDFVSKLFVRETFRNLRVGMALMTTMVEARRSEQVFSSSNLSNMPMLAMFRTLGWIYAGTIDHLDPGDPEVFFVSRPLEPAQQVQV